MKTLNLFAAILAASVLPATALTHDNFQNPPADNHPQTWFHFISGNVSKEGITADLEAIAAAGFSGVQLFHGHFNDNVWPGVTDPIKCLDPKWDDAVRHAAAECERLGLRFTMQNCPGWAMAGGPWIKPENAMRQAVMSTVDITGNGTIQNISLPKPKPSSEDWRDYRDIAVLAFPTPEANEIPPFRVTSTNNPDAPWQEWLSGARKSYNFAPASGPYSVEVTFERPVALRSIELPCVESMNHGWCYEPGVHIAVKSDGKTVLDADIPQGAWQDEHPVTLALDEHKGSVYTIEIRNAHDARFDRLRISTAARKNNWEAEAGLSLRAIERTAASPHQSEKAFVDADRIIDITSMTDADGNLTWKAPAGRWTVMRIGHVNTGRRNGPAPVEGTGWECDKLSRNGSKVHFDNYIGRLSAPDGPAGTLLKGMLMDSWECATQTWTTDMEQEFASATGYELRKWLPAIFGYVVADHETTTRFLRDWRLTINGLTVENFYGNMASQAHDRGLSITYETAIGDVVPGDILEYFKYADVPMCEFWQPMGDNYVGSINFKPIKPTASAARMYGKKRVAAEAFTSFAVTWKEKFEYLKSVADANMAEGVSHLVFHTYTHNPQVGFLPPGTSFGGQGIGTPFLRGQAWWPYMHCFTDYLARCSYMMETGHPVSDVLWYLGDEMDHKPDQNAPFPAGYKYDYCNPDVLINRLSVADGRILTPEGISYALIWIPENRRMLPETVEALDRLVRDGATIVGNAPEGISTLTGGKKAAKRLEKAVKQLWNGKNGVRLVGNGRVISGTSIEDALKLCGIAPDMTGGDAMWSHFRDDDADWYFVAAPKGSAYKATADFRNNGYPQIWSAVDGSVTVPEYEKADGRTRVKLDLPAAGSCFVVFTDKPTGQPTHRNATASIDLDRPWTLSFPAGWGAPESINLDELKPWCDIDTLGAEARAFAGTATYTTTFDIKDLRPGTSYTLDLGRVADIADITVNGQSAGILWCEPYTTDISKYLREGTNELSIKVTGTWFNRLVYDAGLPADQRKTWNLRSPSPQSDLQPTGLHSPVKIVY